MSDPKPVQNIPFSPEMEEAVLGAILIDPDLFDLLSEHLQQRHFFLVRHQWIWHAYRRLLAREDRVDIQTVSKELNDLGHLDEIGGPPYLVRLVNNTPDHFNAPIYARMVVRDAMRRDLLRYSDEVKELALNRELDLEHVSEQVEARLQTISQQVAERTEQPIGEVMSAVYDEFQRRVNKQELFYLPTGYKAIDQFCSGLERGCIHIVGGKPGMGKSSLCLGMAIGAARLGVRVAFISNEMESQRMGMRIAAMESGINLQGLKRGEVTEDEGARFVEALGRLNDLPMYLDYIPQTTVAQVHAKILRMQRQHGLDAVFIDGLWRMQAPEFTGDTNRNSINGYLTDNLVRIAKETNVAMIVTHQLTKKIDDRSDKRPNKGDLEYGGQIDQNADVIMLIYREDAYDEASARPGEADIIFDKNRDAPTGTVTMVFDKKTTRFLDATPRHIDLRASARAPIFINGEKVDR